MSDKPILVVDPKILAAQAVQAAQVAAAQAAQAQQIPPAEEKKEQLPADIKEKPRQPFYFSLDKNGVNPIVDSCSHLLALLQRLRSLDDFDGADALYQQVKDEIELLDKKLSENGITELTVRSASRFCLCAALDDVILKKIWGKESQWQDKSLLSLYHREARVDDEFYKILSRLMHNPNKYKDVLELFYLCLLLGYEGNYCAENGREQKRKEAFKKLKLLLARYRTNPASQISEPQKHQVKKAYQIEVDYPRWPVYLVAALTITSIYLFFEHLIDRDTANLLQQLKQLGS